MSEHNPFDLDIEDLGTVRVAFRDKDTVTVKANYNLLYDGLLYSFDGAMGNHGGAWYPISGTTITGQLGSKDPKKVADPIASMVSQAISAHIQSHPELIVAARQAIYDAKTKSLEGNVKYHADYAERYAKRVDEAQAALAKHLAGAP